MKARCDLNCRCSAARVALIVGGACFGICFANPAVAKEIPREAAKLVQEGNRLLDDGKYAEALAAFDKAGEIAPDAPEIAFNRGVALYRLGDFGKAQSAFQDAM